MRRAMRACPVSERCLAIDSCRRLRNFASSRRSAAAPSAASAKGRVCVSIGGIAIGPTLRLYDTSMTIRSLLARLSQQEGLNFLLTNRIPRRLVTRFIGWFSKIEQPLVRDLSIGVWRTFSDLDLSEAQKAQVKSMHDCFLRGLKEGAPPGGDHPARPVRPREPPPGALRGPP